MKYFKFSNKLFALLFMITSMMFVGCQKDEQKNLKSEDELSTEIRTNVKPTVENGTLKFSTEGDAYQYMRQLEQELDNENNDVLSKQTAMGFKSLLRIVKSKEGEIQPEITENNNDIQVVNDRTGSIFSAPYLNAMLNPNYEIIIGDKVYVHKNHEETWIAPKTSTKAVAVFRAKAPGSFILDTEITSDMEIDGKKESVMMMECCTRYGRFTRSQARIHNGATIRLDGTGEVVRGSWWGIFVKMKSEAFRNNTKTSQFNLDAVAFGNFRSRGTCELRYQDRDEDVCLNGCRSVDVSVFYHQHKRDAFMDRGVGMSGRLFLGTPGQFLWVDIFPPCN